MTYAVTNQPYRVAGGLSGGRSIWFYEDEDDVATVRVDGYFTDGYDLGMRTGDLVIVLDNDASPITGALCWVTSATAADGVDLSNGVTITGTDSD